LASGVAAFDSAAAQAKGAAPVKGLAGSLGLPSSPATTPFVEVLPVAPIARPAPLPFPTLPDPVAVNIDGSTAHHVHGPRSVPAGANYFLIHQRQANHSYHPQLPLNSIWGYNGHIPGPTFISHSGKANLVRFVNYLPLNPASDPLGIGTPISAVHHHGGFQAPEDDGYPTDTFAVGQSRDYLYPNLPDDGLPQNEQSTTWYHDHAIDVTAENVYRGLSGFYLNFDQIDSYAGEVDPNPLALKLPGRMRYLPDGSVVRDYDIPIVIQDRQFDARGFLTYNSFDHDGFLGDKFLANGKIQPYLNVEARKYRFRFCNGANARIFDFFLSGNRPFDYVIATDDHLLEAPLKGVQNFRLAPGERVEVVIDFGNYAKGTVIHFENRLLQTDGRKPDGLTSIGTPIIKFIVGDRPAADPSKVPLSLRPLQETVAMLLPKVKVQRTFEFGRLNGAWVVNNRFFDENRIDAKPRLGEPEIWTLKAGGGWLHPVHIHLSSFFILTRDGKTPPLLERGRKDVIRVGADEKDVTILIKFNHLGRYAFHCHNIEHEDMRMMGQFEVVA
jgi:FtsP/CotA-like multicopper oxidase with cupredoxin domain